MTLIGPPVGGALRRALVRPATKCGYRFEDDELVEQMLAEVEGERGALPLLAFAAAQLWEQRDRETGHLTREAYHDIGGVGGALARHAEATIDRIGTERVAHVRELFRNLVTAEGTRAVREWTELLSVFEEPQRESAEEVLRELIDARLLTSYEVREDDHEPTRRVEIIHESLLANWPRLVRWQTQDQEGAQIRDELRQAARSWDEHGRHDDRLWAGTAYREFQLWRERYPGGLTEAEEAFAAAMTSLATRRRRRRRISVAAAFAILLTVLAVVGSFWRRSVLETRRAEAAELVAHGQLELNGYPTASLAHAITSLELSDSRAARMLAVEALWKGPTAFVVNETSTRRVQFTSDGQWLTQAVFSGTNEPVRLIGADGSSRVLPKPAGNGNPYPPEAGGNSDLFSMQHWGRNSSGKWFPGLVTLWSAAEARILGEARYEGRWVRWVKMNSADRRFLIFFSDVEGRFSVDTLSFDGTTSHLGTREFDVQADGNQWRYSFDARTGRRVATSTGHDIYAMEVNQFDLSKPRFVGDPIGRFIATSNDEGRIQLWDLNGMDRPRALEGPPAGSLAFTHDGRYLKSWVLPDSGDGEFWIWSLDSEEPQMMRQLSIGQKGPMSGVLFDPLDRHLVRTGFDLKIRLWPFSAPADAEPLELLRGEVGQIYPPTFHPQGTWLASADEAGLALWPLARRYPSVMRRHSQGVNGLVFGPQGRWFASSSYDGSLRLWPLDGEVPEPGRALFDNPKTHLHGIATSPRGDRILVAAATNRGAGVLFLIDLNGEPPQVFAEAGTQYFCAALSPDGRLAAGSSGSWGQLGRYIGVWDIASEEQIAVLAKDESPFYPDPRFIDDHHIMGLDVKGVRRWDINTGESSMLHEGDFQEYSASGDGRRLLLLTGSTYTGRGSVIFVDLESNAVAALETHGADVVAVKLDVTGKIAVTASSDGAIRVGRVDGAEPYVLIGHENSVTALAIDPLGRWIASGSKDTTVRLWPMPDLSKPPLHTLPHDELIAKLKTLTNVRVVRDEESPTGWKITHDPFPGWETVPTW
jgi:WD40 repeat protein